MSHLDLHVIQLPILLDAEVPVLRHRDHAGLGADHEVVLAAAVYSKPMKAKEVNDSLELKYDASIQHQSITTAHLRPLLSPSGSVATRAMISLPAGAFSRMAIS